MTRAWLILLLLAVTFVIPADAQPPLSQGQWQAVKSAVPGGICCTITGAFKVTGAGPHAIGSTVPGSLFRIGASFTGTGGGQSIGLDVQPTITAQSGQSASLVSLRGTLVRTGSTHPDFMTLDLSPLAFSGGAFTVTNGSTLKISGAPVGATNSRALWVSSGASQLDGGLGIGAVPVASNTITFASFLFANIGTALTANGQIGFCSDCTIANPCASGGTGAIAKRLNGVNVCN